MVGYADHAKYEELMSMEAEFPKLSTITLSIPTFSHALVEVALASASAKLESERPNFNSPDSNFVEK